MHSSAWDSGSGQQHGREEWSATWRGVVRGSGQKHEGSGQQHGGEWSVHVCMHVFLRMQTGELHILGEHAVMSVLLGGKGFPFLSKSVLPTSLLGCSCNIGH